MSFNPLSARNNEEAVFRYSNNSEAKASELLEYIEEILSPYHMHSDMFNSFKFPTMQQCCYQPWKI